jgi:hypothetical protein
MTTVIVPEGMLKAVEDIFMRSWFSPKRVLEAALRWLAENPIVPTEEQVDAMARHHEKDGGSLSDTGVLFERDAIAEWQRRMFLAPDQEGPTLNSSTRQIKALRQLRFLLAPNGDDLTANVQVGPISQLTANKMLEIIESVLR